MNIGTLFDIITVYYEFKYLVWYYNSVSWISVPCLILLQCIMNISTLFDIITLQCVKAKVFLKDSNSLSFSKMSCCSPRSRIGSILQNNVKNFWKVNFSTFSQLEFCQRSRCAEFLEESVIKTEKFTDAFTVKKKNANLCKVAIKKWICQKKKNKICKNSAVNKKTSISINSKYCTLHPCFSSITKKSTLEFNLWAKIFFPDQLM